MSELTTSEPKPETQAEQGTPPAVPEAIAEQAVAEPPQPQTPKRRIAKHHNAETRIPELLAVVKLNKFRAEAAEERIRQMEATWTSPEELDVRIQVAIEERERAKVAEAEQQRAEALFAEFKAGMEAIPDVAQQLDLPERIVFAMSKLGKAGAAVASYLAGNPELCKAICGLDAVSAMVEIGKLAALISQQPLTPQSQGYALYESFRKGRGNGKSN